MADRLSRERRSWNMGRIRGRNTAPELLVRSVLHRLGLRFRLHTAGLAGRPDIVLRRWRTVIFVHGCFWHRHEGCKLAYVPKSRVEFWTRKFADTTARDLRNRDELVSQGWRVLIVWECEIGDEGALAEHLQREFCGLES